MATTYAELIKATLLGFPRQDGEAVEAIKRAINDAHKAIARARNFDDLIVLDKTSADTVDGTSLYHLTSGLSLTRPKDILSIRLEDTTNSRRLIWVHPDHMDNILPYPDSISEGKPTHYTRRGMYIEMFPTPDAAYDLWIHYAQWPLTLTTHDSESSYANANIDDVIVSLSKDIAFAILNNTSGDWVKRAKQYLLEALGEEYAAPDEARTARPFNAGDYIPKGEWWNNPWVKEQP